MKPWLDLAALLYILVEIAGNARGQVGYCQLGYNYPTYCPREFDPPSYTRCCRSGHYAACCEDRANYVCATTRTGKYSGFNKDPGPDDFALFCPQPSQPDNYQTCCWRNGVPSCCDTRLLGGIMGGVFGTMLLVGIIIAIVCCVKIKKGDWVCVKVRRGKTVLMTKERLQALQGQRDVMRQQQQMQLGAMANIGQGNPNFQYDSNPQAEPQPAPVHGGEKPQPGQYWDPSNMSMAETKY